MSFQPWWKQAQIGGKRQGSILGSVLIILAWSWWRMDHCRWPMRLDEKTKSMGRLWIFKLKMLYHFTGSFLFSTLCFFLIKFLIWDLDSFLFRIESCVLNPIYDYCCMSLYWRRGEMVVSGIGDYDLWIYYISDFGCKQWSRICMKKIKLRCLLKSLKFEFGYKHFHFR